MKNWLVQRETGKKGENPPCPSVTSFFCPFLRSVFASYELSCSPPSESVEQATRYRNTITHYMYINLYICIDNDCILFPRKIIFFYCMYLAIICHNRLPGEPHYPKDPPPLPTTLLCEQRLLSCMAFSVYNLVNCVACQFHSWFVLYSPSTY